MNIVELTKESGLQLNVFAESYPVIAQQLENFYRLAFSAGAAYEREKQAESHRDFAAGNGKLYNLGYDAGYKAAVLAERESLEQHKPHEECECNVCLNYFTDRAHEEALAIRCYGCDYCNNPLFSGTKCNNCGRVVEQTVSQEPKSDCPCCGAKSSVLPMAFCRECKSEFWPPQPVRTKDLTDDEIEEALRNIDYFKTYSQIRIAAARAVIAADRRKNGITSDGR